MEPEHEIVARVGMIACRRRVIQLDLAGGQVRGGRWRVEDAREGRNRRPGQKAGIEIDQFARFVVLAHAGCRFELIVEPVVGVAEFAECVVALHDWRRIMRCELLFCAW
jgi:hypothetical protein